VTIEDSGVSPRILETDICIVGAGAAGISLALQFAEGTSEVCLVESGGLIPDEDTQALYDLHSTGYSLRSNYMSRARYFGGSCNLWAGRSMMLADIDFQQREWVPHSGWPIDRGQIDRYSPAAAKLLRLPPPTAIGPQYVAQRLSPAEQQLFLPDGPFVPTVSLWAKSAMRFGSTYRGVLDRARNIRVLLHGSVTAVNLHRDGGHVESVTVMTLAGQRTTIRARVFVLACGGLENARLLLASRDVQLQGIGNQHDAVGRFFMDHPRTVFGKVKIGAAQRLALLRGRPVASGKFQLGIGLSPQVQQQHGLLNHYLTLEEETSSYTEAHYQAFVQTMKVALRRGHAGSRFEFSQSRLSDIPNMIYLLSPKELMPHLVYRWYFAARQMVPRKAVARTYVVVYFCEQPPDPDSRVTLSDDTDRLGMPKLRLHWRIGDEVLDSVRRMQGLLAHELERRGIGQLQPSEESMTFTDASHHMGTTRMSAQPESGVVDTQCRVHGVDNLYLAGSSVFPCAGYANPTLTIVALALRLADHLRERLSHS
jgi:choline dehydrogenase-like flavoprotein